MGDFARYRRFYGLPPIPAMEGKIPAILGIAGRPSSLTSTAVYQIVKDAFRRVADTLQKEDGAKAARVRRASTHWLRHNAAKLLPEERTTCPNIQHHQSASAPCWERGWMKE